MTMKQAPLSPKQLIEINERLDFIIRQATAAKKTTSRKRMKQELEGIRVQAHLTEEFVKKEDDGHVIVQVIRPASVEGSLQCEVRISKIGEHLGYVNGRLVTALPDEQCRACWLKNMTRVDVYPNVATGALGRACRAPTAADGAS